MKIAIGGDHAGYQLKEETQEFHFKFRTPSSGFWSEFRRKL